jgi:hypothetical protein
MIELNDPIKIHKDVGGLYVFYCTSEDENGSKLRRNHCSKDMQLPIKTFNGHHKNVRGMRTLEPSNLQIKYNLRNSIQSKLEPEGVILHVWGIQITSVA